MKLNVLAKRLLPRKLISYLKGRNYSSRFPRAVKLAYSVYSEGKDATTYKKSNVTPIIIVPGIFGSKSNWTTLSKTISSKTGRSVISIDARNHGDSEWSPWFTYGSMKEDLLRLMEELDIDKVNIIGHSMGGRVSMKTTLLMPQKIEKLVIVDISPVRMNPDSANLLYMIQRMRSTQFPKGIKLSEARKIADKTLEPVCDNAEMRQFLITNIKEMPDKTFQWKLNLEFMEKGMGNIAEFKCPKAVFNGPTLFIGGGKSNYLKPEDHTEILTFFTQAKFHYIKDAGHWLHAEKPGEFLDLVIPFLKV